MVGSKATHYADARDTAVAAKVAINQPTSPPSQGVTNPRSKISLHPDLLQTPQVDEVVQIPLIRHLVPSPVAQPEALPDL